MIKYRTFRTYIQGHEGAKYLTLIFLFLLLVLSIIFSSFIGSVHISFISVLQIYGSQIPLISRFLPENYTTTQYTIIASIREPEVLGGLVVGASLGIGGAVIQSIFRNPITEPYIIGLSSGAALGAVMTIILGLTFLGLYTQQLLAFIFAMASVLAVYMFALRGGKAHPTYMLLTGVALSFFLSAIVALLLFSNINLENEAFFWLLGSLENINWLELFPVT
ncbi:MAG: FecCD family ABC transporter permease, partial [Thermoplasmataceae archaeon]